MNAMQQFEHIRLLELENKNLRAALIGARDNLRDAEVEMGRLRVEIRKIRELLEHGGLPYRERENPGFPMSLLGNSGKIVPMVPNDDWLERHMQKREREYQEKLRVIAKVQSRPDPQIDTVRIFGGRGDEQGLTEEDKH